MKQEGVSIIISMYNAEDRLESVIGSLAKINYSNYEVVLVDDGSTDDSLSMARKLRKKSRFLKVYSQNNKGVAVGRNFGIAKSKNEFVIVMDDDCVVEQDLIKKILPYFKDKRIGVIKTSIVNKIPNGMNWLNCFIFDYLMASGGANMKNERVMMMINGFRKSVLKEVGYYDENIRGSGVGADVKLFYKIKERYKIVRLSNVKSVHLENKKRFSLPFLIKKSFCWGERIAYAYRNYRLCEINWFLSTPIVLFASILFILSYFVSKILFLSFFGLSLILYVFLRRKFIINVVKRRTIFSLLIAIPLDVIRVEIYNLGSLVYFLRNIISRLILRKQYFPF